jgi:hypothetical protein
LSQILKESSPFALGGAQAMLHGHLVSGGKAHKPSDSTAVLPAWRNTYVHMITYNSPGKANANSLRALAPDTGAYVNEAYVLNPNWKQTFWGSNYAKLSTLKDKYDPSGLLYVSPGINADKWEDRNGRLCRRASVYTANVAPTSDNPNRGSVQELGPK